ncbi:unnamed protein product, partial [Brassica rapa subsp. narinosa]
MAGVWNLSWAAYLSPFGSWRSTFALVTVSLAKKLFDSPPVSSYGCSSLSNLVPSVPVSFSGSQRLSMSRLPYPLGHS